MTENDKHQCPQGEHTLYNCIILQSCQLSRLSHIRCSPTSSMYYNNHNLNHLAFRSHMFNSVTTFSHLSGTYFRVCPASLSQQQSPYRDRWTL